MGETIDVSAGKWDNRINLLTVVFDGGENESRAINGRGRGLIQLWLGPFTGTAITILHAESQSSVEPEDFVVMEDADGPITLAVPANAAEGRVCLPISAQNFHTMFWFKLVSNAPEGEGTPGYENKGEWVDPVNVEVGASMRHFS